MKPAHLFHLILIRLLPVVLLQFLTLLKCFLLRAGGEQRGAGESQCGGAWGQVLLGPPSPPTFGPFEENSLQVRMVGEKETKDKAVLGEEPRCLGSLSVLWF